jgi:hydrogenase expression/formation protein HypC
MCLALPARIVALHDSGEGTVDLGGVRKRISLALVPEATLGDHVIVHVGHALAVLDPLEVEETLRLMATLQTGLRP